MDAGHVQGQSSTVQQDSSCLASGKDNFHVCTVCISLLVDEVDYMEGQGWEHRGQGGGLYGGEKMSSGKQHQPEPLQHLQHAVQRKTSKCSCLSSTHAYYWSGPGQQSLKCCLSLLCCLPLLPSLSRYWLLPYYTQGTRKLDFFP